MFIRTLLLLALSLPYLGPFVQAQTAGAAPQPAGAVTQSDPRLGKLPPELRDQGLALLNQGSEAERVRLVTSLLRAGAAKTMEFLLAVLESEPSAVVRGTIIGRLGQYSHPQVRLALQRHAAADPDAATAILALERLRGQQMQETRQLLDERLALARKNGDDKQLRLLAREHERWVSLARGTMLPTFMQVPPPQFSLKAEREPIRVLAFGDFGTGSPAQKQVAAAMLQYHRKSPFDFAVTLGDNFYSVGMASPSDPRWETWWDQLYDPLGIKFYASLGNHDWGSPDSPAAEVLYTGKSPSWRLPATYYTFTAGPVQFFALDTNEISEAQLLWLKDELARSTARWKVVYGHHPIYSAGQHQDSPRLIKQLLPALVDRADVFLAGHDHDLQHLKPEGRLHFFVSGGGGVAIRPITPGPRSLFAKSAHGFAVLEADAQRLSVKFIGTDLGQMYEYALTK
jgi:hypothetical protein